MFLICTGLSKGSFVFGSTNFTVLNCFNNSSLLPCTFEVGRYEANSNGCWSLLP